MNGNQFHAVKVGAVDIIVSCVVHGVTVEARERFEVKEPMAEPEGPFAPVSKVTASADDGNMPINTLDRDPDSRWSADGKGQYLQLELEKLTQVDRVSIQFYNGHTRSNVFDLEISTDGINYQRVLSHVSSQKQAAYETFDITPVPGQIHTLCRAGKRGQYLEQHYRILGARGITQEEGTLQAAPG